MKTWLLNLWDRLRNSLWFIPALAMVSALLLAAAMLKLDAVIRIESVPGMSWATTTGASARATLSTLAGALVTMTSVVFSITMLTLAQTSAMFGSRLLRNFLNHNVAQCTLAIFLSTSLYCFVILRSIQQRDDGVLFAPHLAVAVGLLGGLASMAAFVVFVHHVSISIQAQTIVRNVADELDNAIERLFPESIGKADEHDDASPSDQAPERAPHALIESQHDGYIQAINGNELLEMTTRRDAVLRLHKRPGNFLSTGIPLATIYGTSDPEQELAEQINECVLVGSRRTPRQDVECAVNELVEVAVRALSPGINDPHTAIACVDYLGAALVRLAGRDMPSAIRRDDEGTLRLIVEPTSFADVLNTAFDEIRHYGRDSKQVMMRLVETLQAIARKVTRPEDRDALLRQAAMVERAAQDGLEEKYDRADLQEQLRDLRDTLDPSHRDSESSAPNGGGDDHAQATSSGRG